MQIRNHTKSFVPDPSWPYILFCWCKYASFEATASQGSSICEVVETWTTQTLVRHRIYFKPWSHLTVTHVVDCSGG